MTDPAPVAIADLHCHYPMRIVLSVLYLPDGELEIRSSSGRHPSSTTSTT